MATEWTTILSSTQLGDSGGSSTSVGDKIWLGPDIKMGRPPVHGSGSSPRQFRRHLAEPFQRRLKVLDHLYGDFIRRRQAVRVDVAIVLQPEDIEVQLVAGGEVGIQGAWP